MEISDQNPATVDLSYSDCATGRMPGVLFLGGVGFFFFFCYRVQTGPGSHPATCEMGNGSSFLGRKAAGEWNWPQTSI